METNAGEECVGGEQEALTTKRRSSTSGGNEAIIAMRRQQGKQLGSPIRQLLEWPFMLHAALVLALIWTLSLVRCNKLLVYVIGFVYLVQVENRRSERTRRRIRHEERKNATRKQLLSDLETAHWLNQVLEKAWPAFLENFASEKFLGPLLPFFLAKYKPWTVQDATVQSFSLGRAPPVFSGLRTLDQLSTDDNLVLEAAMEFVAADDMIAVLSVQLKKRLGALWTKLHISNLHIEGKVRLGVKFMAGWPFVSRLRVSFESVPYVQITARPVTNIGMDVAELPGIASWLDTMLVDALEDTIVKPNMLVINVERIASSWSGLPIPAAVDDSPKVAVALVEILEGTQLKAADANGLSDPFVKGLLNGQRIKTTVKRKTLSPKWREEFRLAVRSWDEPNRLILRVRDKDLFRDDNLGFCEVLLSDYRDGNRHEISLPLKGVKTGRLNLAITVEETSRPEEARKGSANEEETEEIDEETLGSDQYESINVPGLATGIFCILRPGRSVRKTWRRRKGRKVPDSGEGMPETLFSGPLDPDVLYSDSDEDKSIVSDKSGGRRFWKWTRGLKDKKHSGELVKTTDNGLLKVHTVVEDPDGQVASMSSTPRYEDVVSAVEEHEAGRKPVKVQVEPPVVEDGQEDESPASCTPVSSVTSPYAVLSVEPGRRSMKERARGVVKHAEKTAVHLGHSAAHLSQSLFRKRSKGHEGSGELVSPNLASEDNLEQSSLSGQSSFPVTDSQPAADQGKVS